jgi:stage II sporulation protein AA (anti-sigma F factor antagonist)
MSGRIDVERAGGDVLVLNVVGEHDVYSTQGLYEELDTALDRGRSVVVDLSGAHFVDSSFVAALVSGRRRFEEQGKAFTLVLGEAADPRLRRAVEVMGIDRMMGVHADREAALAEIRSG